MKFEIEIVDIKLCENKRKNIDWNKGYFQAVLSLLKFSHLFFN